MVILKQPTFILLSVAGILGLAPEFPILSALVKNSPQEFSKFQSAPTVQSQPPQRFAQNNFNSFFQEGRLPSENRLRVQPPDPKLPVDTDSQYWQPIIFQAGGCSFWMPPGTLTEENIGLATSLGTVSFRTLAANSANSRYLVAYADQLTDSQRTDPQTLLSAIVNRVAPTDKFSPIQNRSIDLKNRPGRELSFQSSTEIIIFRAYLSGNRAYIIGARSPKADGNPSQKTTIFLNSFEFLNP